MATNDVCVPNHLGQEMAGGDFNWSMAVGGPSRGGGAFVVKSLRGCRTYAASAEFRWLNKQHPDTGMLRSRLWIFLCQKILNETL